MPDAADLCRRLDAALETTHLHPQYARGLLRECRAALEPPEPSPARVVLDAWCAARFGDVR